MVTRVGALAISASTSTGSVRVSGMTSGVKTSKSTDCAAAEAAAARQAIANKALRDHRRAASMPDIRLATDLNAATDPTQI